MQVSFFRIPKKSEKQSDSKKSGLSSGSTLQKPSNLKPGQYNHSYGKRPQQPLQPQRPIVNKRSFEADLFMAMEPKKFDVMDVISGMKTLKKEEKKDSTFVPKKPKLPTMSSSSAASR